MNYDTARAYAKRLVPEVRNDRIKVRVPVKTGTHHKVVLLEGTPTGAYEESWRKKCPSAVRDLEIEANVGSIVYQQTTSPASAEPLERYGVVLGNRHIDWGSDADWVVDFGPMGDVTRRGMRSPSSSFRVQRGRVLTPGGDGENVGGAAEGSPGTSHGSG